VSVRPDSMTFTVTIPVQDMPQSGVLNTDKLSIIRFDDGHFMLCFPEEGNIAVAQALAKYLAPMAPFDYNNTQVLWIDHTKGVEIVPNAGLKWADLTERLKSMVQRNLVPAGKVEDFTPTRYPDEPNSVYYLFLMQVRKCQTCGRPIMPYVAEHERSFVFPRYVRIDQEAQMKRAGIQPVGTWSVERDAYLCEECTKAGKDTFTCALCDQERTSDLEQFRYGDPPDFLCTPCYESVSASKWEAEIERIEEAHRYDYE
jgi:hypothetical protein